MLDNNKRKSLGRGLGALLGEDSTILRENPDTKTVETNNGAEKISIDMLYASQFQPRLDFDKEALDALSVS